MNRGINILKEVFKVLINPKKGWDNLSNYCDREFVDLKDIDKYRPIYMLIPLFALIPALAQFLGMTVFKDLYFPEEMLKYAQQENNQQLLLYLERLREIIDTGNISKIFLISLIYYIAELFRPFIFTVLLFFLISAFGGVRNPYKALTVATISLIPTWITSILLVHNSAFTVMTIFIATFYTLYITFNASERFLCIPNDNSKTFQFIIVFAILYLIINSIFGIFIQNIFITKVIFS
ncbi:MAG: hypothetical protein DSY59_04800 [Persephonella sp.]|nr:MAG: hypothetical protein DSY60_03435 [Persephonella sp.]RUM59189.1 MAG: hypothetical protein DSY59_04800 [Persephonella sp.]